MNTPHQEISGSDQPTDRRIITAHTFRETLAPKRSAVNEKGFRSKFHIVDDIIQVRTRLEQYEQGIIRTSS